MKEKINTAMIVLAREARALNQFELAGRLNMSATNLSKIERGDISITPNLVESIASVTAYPPHFFHQPGGIVPHALSYRKRETVAQKLITPINARANIVARHVQFLTRALNIQSPRFPSLIEAQKQLPADAARRLRTEWKLPPGPVTNLTKAAEEANVAVMCFPFDTARVDSRSLLTEDRHPLICLNGSMPGDRARFSLAYELGQLVMHAFGEIELNRDVGHEANLFAAEFLMPEEDIKPAFTNGISVPLLAKLKKRWKVSMISLLYRADDLGFLTPNQKRYLLQQFNAMQIRRCEPVELDIPFEEPKLIKQWIADYRQQTGIGAVEMAALLCLHVDEFIELYC